MGRGVGSSDVVRSRRMIRGVDPLVMESNHQSYSRLMELRSQLTTDRGVEESWSQSISRVVELSVVESICN